MVKEFHNKWMDGEPKATQEGNLVKANLLVVKSTGLFTSLRETNSGLLRELESIPKSKEGILV